MVRPHPGDTGAVPATGSTSTRTSKATVPSSTYDVAAGKPRGDALSQAASIGVNTQRQLQEAMGTSGGSATASQRSGAPLTAKTGVSQR
eukprot:3227173-Amphidinium_carterae.1